MVGEILGEILGEMLGEAITGMTKLFWFLFIIALLGVGFFIYTLTVPNNTFRTKDKPTVTWELKAHGQKVDTIWIYKFK